MKIYLASSWRNARQPDVLAALRSAGHEVYDFRNPKPGNAGFVWRQCSDKPTSDWTVEDYLKVLTHPVAQAGFKLDMDALRDCDACVLVLPCGRSAHLELGWAAGAGKRTIVLCEKLDEPELMYLACDAIVSSVGRAVEYLAGVKLRATESEYLRCFAQNSDFGPGDDDEQDRLRRLFIKQTGKLIPLGWDFASEGETKIESANE